MMTDEQRYLFDSQGFVVVHGVIDSARLARMNAALDGDSEVANPANDHGESRFEFLSRGADFHDLIDDSAVLPLLQELIGPKLRLYHACGMAMGTAGAAGGENLHH